MRYALLIGVLMSVLAACSGGGDDNDEPTATPALAATEQVEAPPADIITGNEEALENVEVDEGGELTLGDEATPVIDPNAPSPTPLPPDFELTGGADDPESLPAATNAPIFGDNPQGDDPPPPGTLEPALTPEVEPVGDFTYISLTQSGGPADTETYIEIYNDGLITVNGEQGNIGLDRIAAFQATIDRLNFFGMQGIFRSQTPPRREDYTYQIYVETPNNERLVNAQDGLMPPELIAFVRQIIDVGSEVNAE